MKSAYELARAEIGTVEWKDGSNPKVIGYFRDAGHASVTDDATAWCAAFVGAMLKRAGVTGTGKLTARSYLEWGVAVDLKDAAPGDILVFQRGNSAWQGHVGFFVGRSGAMVRVLGGNQSDAVKEQYMPVAKLLGVRRVAPATKTPTAKLQPAVERPEAPAVITPLPQPPRKPDPAPPRTSWLQALLKAIFGMWGRK